MIEHLTHDLGDRREQPNSVLVVDETGFRKKGAKSAGVARGARDGWPDRELSGRRISRLRQLLR